MVSEVTLNKVYQAIQRTEREKSWQNTAERITLYIVNSRKEMTNLMLQKILYYVKAISIVIEGVPMIPEPCEAWRLGPVFPTVYEKYKSFGKQEISINLSADYTSGLLTSEERRITDFVLDTFGIYNAWFLKDLTHCEEPWIEARRGLDENDVSNNIIDDDLIADYFKRMSDIYDLKTSDGIDAYVRDMRSKMGFRG